RVHAFLSAFARNQIERIHEISIRVGGFDRVADVDEHQAMFVSRRLHSNALHNDARLPPPQCVEHLRMDEAGSRWIVWREDELMEAAAERGWHRALALGRGQNRDDRMLDRLVARHKADAATPVDAKWRRPSGSQEVTRLQLVHLIDLHEAAIDDENAA